MKTSTGTKKRVLAKGNEAVCHGAIEAGCRFYYGYPITPQNDIPEYMSAHMPKIGGSFLQAESEIATINMMIGTASTGVRVLTSSSGPGISLMQEGLSFMVGSQLPAVIVNISRSGPGLGGIAPSQGDYFQATKVAGHGDARLICLAPHSVQEMYSLTMLAFDLADKYRTPAMILGDAVIGQMKEPYEPTPYTSAVPEKPWALTGAAGRPSRSIKSMFLKEGEIEKHNWMLHEKFQRIRAEEVRFERYMLDGAKYVIVAFGTSARIAKTSIQWARKEGIPVGMLRPVTLFPFPEKQVREAIDAAEKALVIEMNTGQMVDDVQRSAQNHDKIMFFGKPCAAPTPEEIFDRIKLLAGVKK
ncbi:MAG: 3-methyl-2-oxobutanoate dehydrogenase subunit VorB [Syntrophorhabdaceae bacterium]|nr:3-methyl-2-oxobutanoate dehydrogenase subunit VorB [Syntrophorhabdaceae bacterium]